MFEPGKPILEQSGGNANMVGDHPQLYEAESENPRVAFRAEQGVDEMPSVVGESSDRTPAVTATNTRQGDDAGPGVLATSRAAGVIGESSTWMGVYGKSNSTTGGNGVMGEHTSSGAGVLGQSESGSGIHGSSKSGTGASCKSETGEALHAHTDSPDKPAIAAFAVNPQGKGAAVFAESRGSGPAGFFSGNVGVTGHINCNGNLALLGDCQLIGADVAEQFRVTGDRPAEPGSVMVLAGVDSIAVSTTAYDQRVAGIVSGAGNYRPGIVLDRQSEHDRSPLALTGKVWCFVDANEEAIGMGDLLTTSATPGHAMRATDRSRAFGAVIGKALGELRTGRGLIPVLVALQ